MILFNIYVKLLILTNVLGLLAITVLLQAGINLFVWLVSYNG